MKKHSMTIVIVVTLLFAVAMIWWAKSMQSNTPKDASVTDVSIISKTGLHWHPQLEIYVKGEKQEIPNGIGMVGGHKPLHTHDDAPIVHMEFQALVAQSDTTLGEFFRVWGKKSEDFGQTVTMTVNGELSTELLDYHMKDGDKIELRYE